MKRCLLAIDVQSHFRPSQGMIQQVNQLATTMPSAATLFKHNESEVPLAALGKQPPMDTSVQANITTVFDKYGFGLPEGVKVWLKQQNPDEVLVVGGHSDANVLAAGFDVFNAGFKPVMVPVLCFGNDWYMHTVVTGIWDQEVGKVYQSVAELKFGGL
ncbi:MAG: hydrolase [Alphaproteobacteria bacterium CG_4_10_14_0_8_um_filter_53_9]|nr:MAG: hydrolase [Alphaproteobacteria bacterium CG_4_10_14_0_8_um_filter_53_9]